MDNRYTHTIFQCAEIMGLLMSIDIDLLTDLIDNPEPDFSYNEQLRQIRELKLKMFKVSNNQLRQIRV